MILSREDLSLLNIIHYVFLVKFLPNSLTTPSPIPLDPPVTMVTFPAYLRFDVSAPVAIFQTAAPGGPPNYINQL